METSPHSVPVARILLVFPSAGGFSRIPERTWEVKSFFVQPPGWDHSGLEMGRLRWFVRGSDQLPSGMSASSTSLYELSTTINHQNLPGDVA
jgi:hypothetical protein